MCRRVLEALAQPDATPQKVFDDLRLKFFDDLEKHPELFPTIQDVRYAYNYVKAQGRIPY